MVWSSNDLWLRDHLIIITSPKDLRRKHKNVQDNCTAQLDSHMYNRKQQLIIIIIFNIDCPAVLVIRLKSIKLR